DYHATFETDQIEPHDRDIQPTVDHDTLVEYAVEDFDRIHASLQRHVVSLPRMISALSIPTDCRTVSAAPRRRAASAAQSVRGGQQRLEERAHLRAVPLPRAIGHAGDLAARLHDEGDRQSGDAPRDGRVEIGIEEDGKGQAMMTDVRLEQRAGRPAIDRNA